MNKGEITYTIKGKKAYRPIMEYDILACILYGRAASIDLLMAFKGLAIISDLLLELCYRAWFKQTTK